MTQLEGAASQLRHVGGCVFPEEPQKKFLKNKKKCEVMCEIWSLVGASEWEQTFPD